MRLLTVSPHATEYYLHSKLLSVQQWFQTYSTKVARVLYCSGQGRSQGLWRRHLWGTGVRAPPPLD